MIWHVVRVLSNSVDLKITAFPVWPHDTWIEGDNRSKTAVWHHAQIGKRDKCAKTLFGCRPQDKNVLAPVFAVLYCMENDKYAVERAMKFNLYRDLQIRSISTRVAAFLCTGSQQWKPCKRMRTNSFAAHVRLSPDSCAVRVAFWGLLACTVSVVYASTEFCTFTGGASNDLNAFAQATCAAAGVDCCEFCKFVVRAATNSKAMQHDVPSVAHFALLCDRTPARTISLSCMAALAVWG
jgi:hypothetical protein